MFRQKCLVVKNEKTAPGHFTLTLRSPRISKNAKPGQFVQIQCAADSCDPLLPRPFSFLTAGPSDFSVLYQVVGKGTELLAHKKKGDEVWVVGPLGNGFSTGMRDGGRGMSVLVGGGVGIPPLFYLAQELIKIRRDNIHVFLGARDKSLILCERDFKKLGVHLHLATDNGSKGKKGYITDLLNDFLHSSLSTHPSSQIYTCGPTPMLKAVSRLASKYKVSCEVSVEEPMACGFGACLGCAIEVEKNGNKRFAIACCEGPVFKAEEIVW